MIPTAWSVLFDGDRFSPEVTRRMHQSDAMEAMHGELRVFGDLSFARAAESAVEEALRHALEMSLLEILVPVWRRHPEFLPALQASQNDEGSVLFGIGEHEIVSTHQPRVDVVGPLGTLASFEVDLRLELRLQSATLQIEDARLARVTIGACGGKGSLHLDGQELVSSVREDIRFPGELSLDGERPPESARRLRMPSTPRGEKTTRTHRP